MATAVTVDFSQLRRSIDLKRQALSDTAIQERLTRVANAYVEALRAELHAKLSAQASGNMERALCNVVGPWKTSKGWAIGVGDIALVGLPTDAPKSRITIRQFLDWFNEQLEEGPEERVAEAYAERKEGRVRRKAVSAVQAHQARMVQAAEAHRRGRQMQERQREFQTLPDDAKQAERVRIEQQLTAISRQLTNLRRQEAAGGNQAQIAMQRVALLEQEARLERLARILRGIQ